VVSITVWWPETDSLGVPHLTNAASAWMVALGVTGECVLCAGRRQAATTYLDRISATHGQHVRAPQLCLEHGLLVRRFAPPTAQASIWAAELDAVSARPHPGHLARRPYGDSQECAVCVFERDYFARLVLAVTKWLVTPSGQSVALAHPWTFCVPHSRAVRRHVPRQLVQRLEALQRAAIFQWVDRSSQPEDASRAVRLLYGDALVAPRWPTLPTEDLHSGHPRARSVPPVDECPGCRAERLALGREVRVFEHWRTTTRSETPTGRHDVRICRMHAHALAAAASTTATKTFVATVAGWMTAERMRLDEHARCVVCDRWARSERRLRRVEQKTWRVRASDLSRAGPVWCLRHIAETWRPRSVASSGATEAVWARARRRYALDVSELANAIRHPSQPTGQDLAHAINRAVTDCLGHVEPDRSNVPPEGIRGWTPLVMPTSPWL
jgi:hypothetical protein